MKLLKSLNYFGTFCLCSLIFVTARFRRKCYHLATTLKLAIVVNFELLYSETTFGYVDNDGSYQGYDIELGKLGPRLSVDAANQNTLVI